MEKIFQDHNGTGTKIVLDKVSVRTTKSTITVAVLLSLGIFVAGIIYALGKKDTKLDVFCEQVAVHEVRINAVEDTVTDIEILQREIITNQENFKDHQDDMSDDLKWIRRNLRPIE